MSTGVFWEKLFPALLLGILVVVLIGAAIFDQTGESTPSVVARPNSVAVSKPTAQNSNSALEQISNAKGEVRQTAVKKGSASLNTEIRDTSQQHASKNRGQAKSRPATSTASSNRKTAYPTDSKVNSRDVHTVSYVPGRIGEAAFAPRGPTSPEYFPPPMSLEAMRYWHQVQQQANLQEYYWQLNELNHAAARARWQDQIDFNNQYRRRPLPPPIAGYHSQHLPSTQQQATAASRIQQLQDIVQANAAELEKLRQAGRAQYEYPDPRNVGRILPASNDRLAIPVPMPVPVQAHDAAVIPRTGSHETKRVSFNFRMAPWDIVLKRLAEDAGLALQLDEVPSGTFDYYDSYLYTPTEALDVINGYLLQKGFLVIRRDRFLVALNIQNGIAATLIPHIRLEELDERGRNELVSVVIEVPYSDVAKTAKELESLLGKLGHVAAVSDSNRLVVTDFVANLKRIRELLDLDGSDMASRPTEIYKLLHTKAEEIAKAINDFLTSQSRTGVQQTSTTNRTPINNHEMVVVAETSTNSILFGGPPRQVEQIRQLIARLDQAPKQVIIQALLVEVELDDVDEFGVEIGIQDSVLFNRSVIDNIVTLTQTTTSVTGLQTTNQNLISQTSDPGFNFNNRTLGNNTAISPNTVGGQALSNFAFGRVNGDLGFGGLVLSGGSENISILLRALAAERKVNILSRPQIRTVDNHLAKIQIGQQVPVVDGVSVTAVGSANPVIRQDEAGIILNVTPHISPDGTVTIDVLAEKSAFQTEPGSGVRIYTVATSGNVIEAPVKDITSAETTVSIRSGETIVLGGMITKDKIDVKAKVPILGDIPYIGVAFRYKLEQTRRRELLIFLTPMILEDSNQAEKLKEDEVGRTHFPIGDAVQMHGNVFRDDGAPCLGCANPNYNTIPNGNLMPYPDALPNRIPSRNYNPQPYGQASPYNGVPPHNDGRPGNNLPNDNFFPDGNRIPNSGHTNQPFPAPALPAPPMPAPVGPTPVGRVPFDPRPINRSAFKAQPIPSRASTTSYVDRNGIPTVIIPYSGIQKPVSKRKAIFDRIPKLGRLRGKRLWPKRDGNSPIQQVPQTPTWGHSNPTGN